MENPFEKKPFALIVTLGAIVALILGAGVISTYFNNKTDLPVILPDSPYSITWKSSPNLFVEGSPARNIEAKISLLDANRLDAIEAGSSTTAALALKLDVLMIDPASSTERTCAWKLPIGLMRVVDEMGTTAGPQNSIIEAPADTPQCIEPQKPILVERIFMFPILSTDREFIFTAGDPSKILFSITIDASGTIGVIPVPQEIPG